MDGGVVIPSLIPIPPSSLHGKTSIRLMALYAVDIGRAAQFVHSREVEMIQNVVWTKIADQLPPQDPNFVVMFRGKEFEYCTILSAMENGFWLREDSEVYSPDEILRFDDWFAVPLNKEAAIWPTSE
jgi:hypothetical protein